MPASPSAVPISKLTQVKADAQAYGERLATADPPAFADPAAVAAWVKDEIRFNLAPLIESVVDAIHADIVPELADLSDAIDEINEDSEDQVTEETRDMILEVFTMGRAIANLLEGLAKHQPDTVKKRLQQQINAFRTAETAVRDHVVAITVLPEQDEGGDAEAPGDGDDAGAAEGEDAAPDADDAAGGEG